MDRYESKSLTVDFSLGIREVDKVGLQHQGYHYPEVPEFRLEYIHDRVEY
jgi:hypothetical protein